MKNRVNVILGNTGSGKSTLTKKILETSNRVIVLDILREYDYRPLTDFRELVEIIQSEGSFKISFRVTDTRKLQQVFDKLCALCYKAGNITLVIEEIHRYDTRSSDFENCLLLGRHSAVNLVLTSQQPRLIEKKILTEAENVYTFHFSEPYTLYYLEAFSLYPRTAIFNLKQYEFLNLKKR